MKSAIAQMRKWLDDRAAHSGKIRKAELRYIRSKCQELQAKENASFKDVKEQGEAGPKQRPLTADEASGVHEFVMSKFIPAPLATAAKVEPLAVLCERMGYRMRWSKDDGRDMWHISLRPRMEIWLPKQVVHAPTYAECEAKARQYLNGLMDQKKGGE